MSNKPRTMFDPEKLKFYQKIGGNRDYGIHSQTLEELINKEQTNPKYRDSIELSWLKFCVKGYDEQQESGETNKRGISKYHYHDVLKRYPLLLQKYHHFLLANPDIAKAREMVQEEITLMTNKTANMLITAQKGSSLVVKLTKFVNSLTWFEYKERDNKSSDLDKLLTFVASYEAREKTKKK